jgi:hypothetical protein
MINMKFDLRDLSYLNILFFLIALTIYLLPNFIDRDIHRILLSKLNIFVFSLLDNLFITFTFKYLCQ